MVTQEIERRLKKADYSRLPRHLDLGTSYEDTNSQADKLKMLSVADIYGSKYIQFYKIRENCNLDTLISQLVTKTYTPNLDRETNGITLNIVKVQKTENSFSIMADFYTDDPEWVPTGPSQKELRHVYQGRVIHLEKKPNSRYLILTIDPLGDGARIGNDIPSLLLQIGNEYNINFTDCFEIINIDRAFFELQNDGVLVAKNAKAKDDETGRIKEVISTARRDDVSDEVIKQDIASGNTSPEKIRFKYDKETVEMFNRTLMKIGTMINWDNTDELKRQIVSVL